MARDESARRGRPPDPPETARSHRAVTYLTGAELEALTRVADREGKSLSAIIHEILASALNRADSGISPKR